MQKQWLEEDDEVMAGELLKAVAAAQQGQGSSSSCPGATQMPAAFPMSRATAVAWWENYILIQYVKASVHNRMIFI